MSYGLFLPIKGHTGRNGWWEMEWLSLCECVCMCRNKIHLCSTQEDEEESPLCHTWLLKEKDHYYTLSPYHRRLRLALTMAIMVLCHRVSLISLERKYFPRPNPHSFCSKLFRIPTAQFTSLLKTTNQWNLTHQRTEWIGKGWFWNLKYGEGCTWRCIFRVRWPPPVSVSVSF